MEIEKTYLYLDPEALEHGELVLFGLTEQDPAFIPANLEDLKRELEGQKRLFEIGFHPDGKIVPWGFDGKPIVLEEGEFVWDQLLGNYRKSAFQLKDEMVSKLIFKLMPIVEDIEGFLKFDEIDMDEDIIGLVGESILSKNAITIDFKNIHEVPEEKFREIKKQIKELNPHSEVYYGSGDSLWIVS